MRIERYTGRTTRDAMAKVRAELGAEAYILKNRRVDGQVELTAALEIDEALEQMPAPKATERSGGGDTQLQTLERELNRLREILESELGERNWRDAAAGPAPETTARHRLMRLGLSRTLVGSLLQRVPAGAGLDQLWRLALGNLARRMQTLPPNDQPDLVTAVYGGTGVGKTSVIAKLAGREAQRLGVRKLGLITMDSYRVGAQEQIASFADALGIPLIPASDPLDLSVALRQLRGRRVFIDTAGMNQRDERLPHQLDLVHRSAANAEHLLVLAASAQASQCRAIAEAFGPGRFSGAIITKLDEAQTLGGVIDVLIGAGLPMHSVSDGQRIPEDMHEPDVQALIEQAVSLVDLSARRRAVPARKVATARTARTARNATAAAIA